MKKQTTIIALGAILSLAMTATSFAATAHHAKQAKAPASYSGYYDLAVPEGSYSGYANSYSTGGISGAIGGVGR